MSTAPPLAAPQSAPSPSPMELSASVRGVLRAPRATFAALVVRPRWIGAALVGLAVSLLCSTWFYSTEVGQLALVDQWERTAVAFGQPMNDAAYARLVAASGNAAVYGTGLTLARVAFAILAVPAIALVVFSGMLKERAAVPQLLAVASHAALILAVRQVVTTPLQYARETLTSPLSLALFLPVLDEASPLAHFAATIDLFVIWWLVTLALGLSVLYRRRATVLVLGLLAAYAAVALTLTLAMALTGGAA